MFRRKVADLRDVLNLALRQQGLETPLRQCRLIESWGMVAGHVAEQHTLNKYIRNQTLHVQVDSPALRQDLSMRRTELARQLNAAAGAFIISDIHIY